MKILVTGANGYLGVGIVKLLLDKGNEVVAVGKNVDSVDNRAQKVECNIFDITDPYICFGKPDALLHLAWRDGFKHYSDSHILELPNHYKFIKKLTESDIRLISVMGSMHEIGFWEGPIKEDTPCRPVTPYGIAKNALRELTSVLCEQTGKTFIWLRGFYIVSNNAFGSSVFSKLSQAEFEGKKTFPFTMGQNQFDFIDYEDFVNKVCCAISQEDITGVINICSGWPEKLADRVERFIKENNYSIRLEYGAFPNRPYDSKAIWGDTSKIDTIVKNTDL